MAEIRLNSGKLHEASRKLRQIRSKIDEDKRQLHRVQSDVMDHWISDSTETYMSGLEQSEYNLRRLASKTAKLAESLEKLAEAAERIERENAASFGGGGGFSGGGGGGGGGGGR